MTSWATLDQFIDAGPWPERAALRALVHMHARPRARRLLERHAPLAAQLATSMRGLGAYDDPATSAALGYDPQAVVARGRLAAERR
jgi:hypothetical protein